MSNFSAPLVAICFTLLLFPSFLIAQEVAIGGTFKQQLFISSGETMTESTGKFQYLAPAHFRWTILEPHFEELVVTPEKFWHYDASLEVVTLRSVPSLEAIPLFYLWLSEAELAERADVQRTKNGYRFIPSNPSINATTIDWQRVDEVTYRVVVIDKLANEQHITIYVDPGAFPVPGDFVFVLPDGIELIPSY